MIREHERVVLKEDQVEHDLEKGDVGTVVHVYRDKQAVEVEFFTLTGETFKVITLKTEQVRSVRKREVTHARELIAV